MDEHACKQVLFFIALHGATSRGEHPKDALDYAEQMMERAFQRKALVRVLTKK